jgi:hypothetical protein
MTKPRFTAEPIPEIDDPTLRAYLERHFNRLDDYWPQDLENRLAMLERQWPYLSGSWPIVDGSYVYFRDVVPSYPATACIKSTWEFERTMVSPRDSDYNGSVSLARNGTYVIVGSGGSNRRITVLSPDITDPGGGWIELVELTVPNEDQYEGYGYSLSHSSTAFRLAVGAPYSDQNGINTGTVHIYTWTEDPELGIVGFTKQQTIQEAGAVSRGQFGHSVEISEDGSVLAVGAPGTDYSQNTQRVYIYDWNGSSYTYRNTIEEVNADTGFGFALALTNDGTKLAIGDASHGVGATGEVTVWEDSGGVFTKQQTIERIDFAAEDIDGEWFDSNTSYFGGDVAFSEDGYSLFIYSGQFTHGSPRAPKGATFIYGMNFETWDYEYCNYVPHLETAEGGGYSGMDVVYEGVSGIVAMTTIPYQFGTLNRGAVSFFT